MPKPEIGRDELLVKVRAAGDNPVDTYFREGTYEPTSMPMVTGSDVAGVVRNGGSEVADFKPGDRVFATALGTSHQGNCAEFTAVPTDRVAILPASIDFETGGAATHANIVGISQTQSTVSFADIPAVRGKDFHYYFNEPLQCARPPPRP